MPISRTTLPTAISGHATQFEVGSIEGLGPDWALRPHSGIGFAWLVVDGEFMQVAQVHGRGMVSVTRGQGGTPAMAHAAGALVLVGGNLDFPNFKVA